MEQENAIRWIPFTPETMPPIDARNRFLVLYGLGKADRILCIGKYAKRLDVEPTIMIVGGDKGWQILTDDQMTDAAWAPVTIEDSAINSARAKRQRIARKIGKAQLGGKE